MKPEFEIGDTVHFQPYSDRAPIEARVVDTDDFACIYNPTYTLTGIRDTAPLRSITSGRSIVESKLFDPIDSADAFKDSDAK